MPETLDFFAAELAFGLLDGSERLDALQLQLTNTEFAAAVARWETIAAAWLDDLPVQPLSPQLWDRVSAIVAPAQTAAKLSLTATSPHASVRGPGLWRPLAIAASLMACLFAGLWLSPQIAGPPSRQASGLRTGTFGVARNGGRFSVAQLGGTSEPQLATVLYDRDAGTLTIRIAALETTPARAPEVWLINGANPPRSLGFGQAGAAIEVKASARLKSSLVGGATLAITLEPLADHPHAAPSSKILGTGTISTL